MEHCGKAHGSTWEQQVRGMRREKGVRTDERQRQIEEVGK